MIIMELLSGSRVPAAPGTIIKKMSIFMKLKEKVSVTIGYLAISQYIEAKLDVNSDLVYFF